MIAEGNGPDRSAFLSAFFALVGCHGVHVTIGLLWLGTMMAQYFSKGFRPGIMRGLCFALFGTSIYMGWHLHQRLPLGNADMSDHHANDAAPGEGGDFGEHSVSELVRNYVIGLFLATVLTITSFYVASGTALLDSPGVLMGLAALAVAQMGVHLVFFLHITTGADNTNNALALAFGALIVGLVIAGSVWIMYPPEREHDAARQHDGYPHAALSGAPGILRQPRSRGFGLATAGVTAALVRAGPRKPSR